MTMIETTELTKQYGDITAVDSIDLTVDRGSIHGFVGHNGAGKSTTMQLLVGLITPTAGEAYIDGEPAGSVAATRKIGYAPQEPSFYESMTGRRYLRYMADTAGLDGDIGERVDDLLAQFGLEDAATQQIDGYSGGMARKLSLAQAMIHDPELLILDEPTAALDPEGRASIIETLEEMTDDGLTVFVSSHVLSELEQFIDTVTIINEGKLITSGPLETIRTVDKETYFLDTGDNDRMASLLAEQPAVGTVSHREDGRLTVRTDEPAAFRRELPALLAEEGIPIRELEQETDLQEAFFELTDTGGA